MSGPLNGIRVLDLSRVLAGPWCSQNLGDLGAEIIKIERPGAGDDSRAWGPPWYKDQAGNNTRESAYYWSANRNKRSVAVDISRSEGQDLIRKLAETADVCLENFKTGDLARYGLDWPSLKAVNPRLVYCSITGYGQDGPYASSPGYDYVFQGISGLMNVTGEPEGRPGAGPQRVGAPVVDLFTGMYATVAILGALHHQQATGEGQAVDVSLLDTGMALNSGLITTYMLTGVSATRTGNRSPNVAVPYTVFPCADGKIIVAAGNQRQFQLLCDAVGRPEVGTDPRFASNGLRMTNGDALFEMLAETFRTRPRVEWEKVLEDSGIPGGPINDFADAVQHPQVKHRKTVVEMTHPLAGSAATVGSPMRFSGTAVEYDVPPPLLGQDTVAVLKEAGFADERIGELESLGIIQSLAKP